VKVLVTGGTSGLGLAMASALATAGATVALTGRSGQHASSVAAEVPGAVGIELDVRDESSVARAVDQAWSRLGGIDMLVNNAGIGMRTGVTVNLLLPGGPAVTGMLPLDAAPEGRRFLEPAVMGPPIVWLASDDAAGVHDERIVAVDFERWLRDRNGSR
jgi:NAD(P)-dependent dehydrogenase (short-subunit alcohol dehydrogenase family)